MNDGMEALLKPQVQRPHLLILNNIVLPAVVFLLLSRVALVGFCVVRNQDHRLVIVSQWRWRLRSARGTSRELSVGRLIRVVYVMCRMYSVMLRMDLLRLNVNCIGLDVARRQLSTVLIDSLLPMVAMACLSWNVIVVAVRIYGRNHVGSSSGSCSHCRHCLSLRTFNRVVTPRSGVLMGSDLLLRCR